MKAGRVRCRYGLGSGFGCRVRGQRAANFRKKEVQSARRRASNCLCQGAAGGVRWALKGSAGVTNICPEPGAKAGSERGARPCSWLAAKSDAEHDSKICVDGSAMAGSELGAKACAERIAKACASGEPNTWAKAAGRAVRRTTNGRARRTVGRAWPRQDCQRWRPENVRGAKARRQNLALG